MPAPRRLRLRAGADVALGSFELPAHHADLAVTVDFQPARSALWLEIPDAANLNAGDARTHGVHLLSADLRLEGGEEFPLFAAP